MRGALARVFFCSWFIFKLQRLPGTLSFSSSTGFSKVAQPPSLQLTSCRSTSKMLGLENRWRSPAGLAKCVRLGRMRPVFDSHLSSSLKACAHASPIKPSITVHPSSRSSSARSPAMRSTHRSKSRSKGAGYGPGKAPMSSAAAAEAPESSLSPDICCCGVFQMTFYLKDAPPTGCVVDVRRAQCLRYMYAPLSHVVFFAVARDCLPLPPPRRECGGFSRAAHVVLTPSCSSVLFRRKTSDTEDLK